MRTIPFFILLFLFVGCSKNSSSLAGKTLEFTGKVDACGDFFVVQSLDENDNTVFLSISGDNRESLDLNNEYKLFQLPHDNIVVTVTKWNKDNSGNYCNDAIELAVELEKFTATAGSIKLKADNVERDDIDIFYNISIELENIVLENKDKEQTEIPKHAILDQFTGWLPG